MFALVTLPSAPLWAQNNNSQSKTEGDKGSISNGTYLYGQSPQPDQLGKQYIVFEATGEGVVGALYMPHSEFSCFQGEIAANRLEMTVNHPYNKTAHPYAIALEETSPIASRDGRLEQPLMLEGYHQLETLSQNDRRMLAACREEFR